MLVDKSTTDLKADLISLTTKYEAKKAMMIKIFDELTEFEKEFQSINNELKKRGEI